MSIPFFVSILITHFLGASSPGPDFLITVKNSVQYSKKAGISTGFGIFLANMIHIFYNLVGISLLISKSILLFNIIKYLGICYLIYLGIKSILSKNTKQENISIKKSKSENNNSFKFIKIGFLTSLLNPYVSLYYLMMFSTVIDPNIIPIHIVILLIICMLTIVILWFSLVSIFFSNIKIQNIYYKFQRKINILFGILLIGLGLKIFFT